MALRRAARVLPTEEMIAHRASTTLVRRYCKAKCSGAMIAARKKIR